MHEEEYRAEMAKQARLANLIALRRLMAESASFTAYTSLGFHNSISREILELAAVQ